MDSVLDSCFKDCHNNFFHKLKYECIYDIKFKNITNIELINFTVSSKNMDLYDLNNKLKVARERGFIFIHINKLTIKNYSHRRFIDINYYLKFPMPMCQRQFFRVISQNPYYVYYFCDDSNNLFHFACHKCINQVK